MKGDLTLTEKELEQLAQALRHARDNCVLIEETGKLSTLTKKVDKTRQALKEKKRNRRSDYDCETQGHDWGEISTDNTTPETLLLKGCNKCPVLAYRPLDAAEWTLANDFKEYVHDTKSDTFNIGGKP